MTEDKMITKFEIDPNKDAVLILRENRIEFQYPTPDNPDAAIDSILIPMIAIALLYGQWSEVKKEADLGAMESMLLSMLWVYVESHAGDILEKVTP